MKPIILLDVDGVLNPAPFKASWSPDWKFEPTARSCQESGGWPLNLSKEMGRAILDLNCEIRWLTTWIKNGDFANPNIGARLDWPRLSICPVQRKMSENIFWKPLAVKEFLENPGPKVVWIDDEADTLRDIFTLDELDPHRRLLVINPEPFEGLTKEQLNTIQVFLKE